LDHDTAVARNRVSYSAVAVLHALAQGHRHGFDLIDATGLTSATVYPTLGKLEEAGLVSSTWESHAVARKDKRPARRYYELRAEGVRVLKAELERYRALQNLPAAALNPRTRRS
jgi:DNA-binding PadR family transcriptional regulator